MRRRPLATTSVRDALDSAVIALTAAGCDTPRLDAEVLLADVLGTDRAALFSAPERPLTSQEAARFREHAMRRRGREPVAYIVGTQGFRWLELHVDRRVLVPRPETEHLVEAALSADRRSQVGTGDRAEKIRTYNFGERRVTDHRVKLTQHNLEQVLEGELDEFTNALQADEKRRKLEAQAAAA